MINETFLSKLAESLVFHSVLSKPEELNANNQKEIIKSFQAKKGLMVNGELAVDTLWELQEEIILSSEKMKIVEIPVDKIPGIWGMENVTFREDSGAKFEELLNEVRFRGGTLSISAGVRDIKMVAGTGQSPTSMHYPGLAFDLNLKAGFFDPDKDTYIITKVPAPNKKDPKRFGWNVFCRSENGEEMELEAYYWENEKSGVDLTKKVIGKFIDFTALAGKYGFQPIRPQSCFTRETNRFYICCEWWHFQANDLLIPNFSLFGAEIMRIEGFTPEFLQKRNPRIWDSRKFVYFKNWW